MSNSLDPDQTFGQPDLGSNCLQSLSAEDTCKQRIKEGVISRVCACVRVLARYFIELQQRYMKCQALYSSCHWPGITMPL